LFSEGNTFLILSDIVLLSSNHGELTNVCFRRGIGIHNWFSPVSPDEYIGILISNIFVFVIIGIATVLRNRRLLSVEGSRKFIHIGLANWWIPALLIFHSNIAAAVDLLLLPLSFFI
jgi:hypothetical protein